MARSPSFSELSNILSYHPICVRVPKIPKVSDQAHEIVCTKEMAEEISNPNRYDLEALPAALESEDE